MRTEEEIQADYRKYRGKCKELVDELCAKDPTLKAVRGHYECPFWGMQNHWWCVDKDGNIVDPSVKQFPTEGLGANYIEFDGFYSCEFCGDDVAEEDVYPVEHHVYCSYECYGHDIGF